MQQEYKIRIKPSGNMLDGFIPFKKHEQVTD
jgi:hypothetical protein